MVGTTISTTTSTPTVPRQQRREHRVSNLYHDMPETRNIRWYDTFFDNEMNNIVAVFDIDYHYSAQYESSTLIWPIFGLVVMIVFVGVAIYIVNNQSLPGYYYVISFGLLIVVSVVSILNTASTAYAQHLAITGDGIRYVIDKHASIFCEVAKLIKTIPFDKVCKNRKFKLFLRF
jgi:hypothetical protein